MMCSVERRGTEFELSSPFFLYRFDTGSGLRAESWTNLISGRSVNLGDGPELEVDIDTTEQRIWITGWRIVRSDQGPFDEPSRDLEVHVASAGDEDSLPEPKVQENRSKGLVKRFRVLLHCASSEKRRAVARHVRANKRWFLSYDR